MLCGCSNNTPSAPELRLVRADVPASLLTCKVSPAVPVEPVNDPQVAGYILDLWDAGDDCRQRLAEVRQLVTLK